MTEPTDQELLRLHDEAANAGMHADGLCDWDAYDGVNDDGLRAVWRAGFAAGAAQ
jgi:hypothetical protein